MIIENASSAICVYCCGEIRLKHQGVFHTFESAHGPFDIHECTQCNSCQTEPPPSLESLKALYDRYIDGLPNLHRRITNDDPQVALYKLCVDRIRRLTGRTANDEFAWLDVGAGGGEFSLLMASAFPRSQGVAMDLHARPATLATISSVEWLQVDVNRTEFAGVLPHADLVVSIAVWEHVLRPDLFVKNLLRLIRPGGMLYMLCPNQGSWASRLLGRRWPYYAPGEHLSMPTPNGAVACLLREAEGAFGDEGVQIRSQAVMLPYTIRYVLRRLGVDAIGRLLPTGWALPLPVGALDAVLARDKKRG